MRTRASIGSALVLALGGTVAVGTASALAEPAAVQCGQVLTSSVVVLNDLSECLEHGLVVGADGITVDLGGHTLDGVGQGAGVLNAGFDDVTITNGTLSGFDFGVLLTAGAGNNVVTGVMPTLNAEAAIQLSGVAPGNEISGNRFGDNGLAVGIAEGSEGAVVRSNVVEASSGHGIHVLGSQGNRIEDNDLTGAADGGIVLHGASGNVVAGNELSGVADGAITLDLESNNNLIEANTVTDSEGGVLIDASFGNQVIGNTVHGMSDDAVDLEESHRTVVLGNDLRFNAGGVELLDSTETRVEGNLTSDSAGTGIAIEGVAHRNAIVKNVSNDNDSFGVTVIGVTLPEDGNLLYRNETSRNGGGGINVAVAGHTLRANEARGNAGWGIYAGTGTIDGGFNTAAGNSESSQCFGVVCLPLGAPPVDTSPPDTTITDAPRTVTVVASATFEFSAVGNEFGARFECSLDGQEFVGCAPPQRFTGLPHGEHTFAVRAIDLDGNVDSTPAIHGWAYESIPTVDCGATVTVHADADAWIDQNSATSNKGSDSALKVRSKGPNDNFRTLVRFPLPTLTAGCEVDTATLRLYADGPTLGRTLEAVRIAGPWTEDTVSWQTQPRTVGPPAFVPSGEGFRSWNVKAQVQAMYDESGAYGFLVKDADEGADAEHGFNPREDEFAPELVIRYSPVFEAPPEDTTPPDTTIDSGPDPLVFSSTEAGSTFECSVDGVSIDDCRSPLTTGDLPAGPHTFAVAATDPAGNRDPSPAEFAWTVAPPPDTTPPHTSIDDGPEATTTDTAATLVFTADEDASFACALDDDEPAPCASPVTYSDLAVGEHTFSVMATDLAGNTGESVVLSWTIEPPPDTSPPDTSIDTAPPATTTEQSATFTFSANEPGSTFECALDDGGFAPCSSPGSYSGLVIGAHTFAVRAIDAAGNVDPVPAVAPWTVEPPRDTTAPDTLIDGGPPSTTMSTSATFWFSSDDATATFECALDDGAFAGCTSPHDLAGVAVGAHTFWVRASDPAGNVDTTPATYPWTVEPTPPPPTGDETAPRTTITGGPGPTTAETTATFAFSANEERSTFECALDESAFAPCSSPTTYSGLALGAHTFLVRATDPAGNVEDPPATSTWEVVEPPDTTAPTVTILDGPSTTTSETTASFTFVVDEPATTECALDIAAFAPCTSPSEHNDLALGTHTFAVRATDQAGNQSATSFVWTVVAPPDTTPPVVSIISGPPSPTSATSATFEFTVNEPATIRCALDDGAFVTCGSPLTYPSVALGQHTFQARATDAAGNVGSASWSWTIVDTVAPITTISSGPPSQTTATSATFNFAANEVGARFECRLDSTADSAFSACTSPRTYSGLAVGAHTFSVRAIDPSGNVDASPASFGWIIQPPPDTTPPQTTITSGPPAQTLSTSAAFEFQANEPSSTFQCRLDGGAWLACTSPRTYVNVPVGSHLFEVRATDLAGNLDATPAPHPWTVQPPPPPPPPGATCSVATLTASADAWIDQNSAMTNKGDDSILKVRSKGPADNFRALLRFDRLPPAPAGCVIGSATLRLHSGSSGEGRSLVAQRTAGAWTENGVTWANQPAAEGPTATTAIVADVDDLEWNVQPHVNAAQSAGTVSFVIRDAVEGDDAEQQYHSREKGENPPVLVIQFVQLTN